jgi:hypothetical protein
VGELLSDLVKPFQPRAICSPFFESRSLATSPVEFVGEMNSIHLLGQGCNPCPGFLVWFQSLCPPQCTGYNAEPNCDELYPPCEINALSEWYRFFARG